MSVVYFVRHAHAQWTPDEQRSLSVQGAADAQRVADVLDSKPIAVVYSSPARRAYQTIEPLASKLGLDIHIMPALRERELSRDPVPDFTEAIHRVWHDPDFAFSGGESNTTAQQRGVKVITTLLHKHPHEHMLIGTHGNLLALILQQYDRSVDFAFWQALTMPDIYEVHIEHGGAAHIQRLWT